MKIHPTTAIGIYGAQQQDINEIYKDMNEI